MSVFTGIVLPIVGSLFILTYIFHCMAQLGMAQGISPGLRRKRKLVIAVYMLIVVAISLLGNGLLNLVLLLLIPVLGHYFYNRSRRHLLCYITLVTVMFLSDALIVMAFSWAIRTGLLYFRQMEMAQLAVNVGLRGIEFALLMLVTRLLMRSPRGKIETGITGLQLASYLVLPAFSLVNIFTLFYFIDLYVTEGRFLLLLVNLFLLVGVNVYFTKIFDAIIRYNRMQQELALLQQHSTAQAQYYEGLERQVSASSSLLHDWKNHLQALSGLLNQDAEALEYAQALNQRISAFTMRYYTAHKLLNLILNDKVNRMEAVGILPDIRIGDVDLSFMQTMDVTAVFANILDNAIEAHTGVDQPIRLRVEGVHNFVSITLSNPSGRPSQELPHLDVDSLESTKVGHKGLGMKSVARVVTSYGGDLQCEWRDGNFTTRILLDCGGSHHAGGAIEPRGLSRSQA